MRLRKRRKLFAIRQARPPVDDLRQAVLAGGENQGLTGIIEPPASHHLTAPSVSPAMKCRCIRKNISTGGSAAMMEPADTRCHAATHCPLSE